MGQSPMPEGCTHEQFLLARDAVWESESREYDLNIIKEYLSLPEGKMAWLDYEKQEYDKAVERVMYG